MLKHSKACRADPDLLPQLAPQALLIGFPSLDVAPDHVPHPRTSLLLRAAAPEQDASLSHQHSPDKARPLRHAPAWVSRGRAEILRVQPVVLGLHRTAHAGVGPAAEALCYEAADAALARRSEQDVSPSRAQCVGLGEHAIEMTQISRGREGRQLMCNGFRPELLEARRHPYRNERVGDEWYRTLAGNPSPAGFGPDESRDLVAASEKRRHKCPPNGPARPRD